MSADPRSAFLRDIDETCEVSSQLDNANTTHTGASPAGPRCGPAAWRPRTELVRASLDESLPAVDGRFRQILRESRRVGKHEAGRR